MKALLVLRFKGRFGRKTMPTKQLAGKPAS